MTLLNRGVQINLVKNKTKFICSDLYVFKSWLCIFSLYRSLSSSLRDVFWAGLGPQDSHHLNGVIESRFLAGDCSWNHLWYQRSKYYAIIEFIIRQSPICHHCLKRYVCKWLLIDICGRSTAFFGLGCYKAGQKTFRYKRWQASLLLDI